MSYCRLIADSYRGCSSLAVFLLVLFLCSSYVHAEESPSRPAEEATAGAGADTGSVEGTAPEQNAGFEDVEDIAPYQSIADPIEPWNRLMFTFNDRVYFWLMKPASKVYNAVLPEPVRVSVNNFFTNLTTPVRFVNCILKLKMKCAGVELARFTTNSTIGFGGLFDVAKNNWHLEKQDEDLGQTLGYYGIGDGFYIIWPFLGPSSVRDSVGLFGDGFLTPQNYVTPFFFDALAIDAGQYFNDNALHIGDYEDFKEAAIEPYVALRDAFVQHRKSLYKKETVKEE